MSATRTGGRRAPREHPPARQERSSPLLPPDAGHPAHGGGAGQGLRAGQDSAGSCISASARRRWRSAPSRRSSPRTTSSPPTASTATPTPRGWQREGDHGRAVRQGDRLLEGPRRLDAPVRRGQATSSAATASSAATCRWRPASPSPRSTAATDASRCASSATARSPQGAFHEGISLAGLWKLPIVFICENNQYSMGTPLYRTLAVADVSRRRWPTAWRAIASTATTSCACASASPRRCARARNERMPTLVEIVTYRFRGHSMSDPGNYRTKDEIEEWKKRDPCRTARELLRASASVDENELVAIEAKVEGRDPRGGAVRRREPRAGRTSSSAEFTYKE